MKTHWVLVLLLCTSIAFSKTILANSKFAKSIVNSLTAETKSKTPKPAKSSVAYATDTDLDGVTDDLDLDDDNDGILDTVECPATDIVTNGTFTTNLTGWTAGTGWAFSSGTATNTSDFTTSSLSQSLTNLDKVPNNTVSLTVKIGAQDAGNSAGNTSSLDIMLGGVVYATISNSVLRNTSNVTISLAPGVTSNFVTFGTSSITGFTTSTFTVNIPYSGPSSSTLAFRMNSGGDDWSVDDVSISALICDIDGDGIPNYLDLDSDGDGCPDAVEGGGGFTNANLVTATGALATQSPNKNLGNAVGSNGVPTIAGAGQSIGVSQNSNVNACTDSDGDGITNVYDLDNDNDGILDVNEKVCPLTGQTIRIGYIPNSRDLDGDTGYTFDGSLMSGSGALKLTNPANFGPNGTVNANIVLVNMGTAPITKAIINSLNLNAIFLGGINDAAATPNSYLSAAEFNAIKDWSDDSQNNYVVSTQAQTQPWGTSVVSQISNPNVPTSYGSQTSIFKGPFGTVASFTQGGGYQGYFSAINALFGANALAVNGSNGPVMYVDGTYNDLMIADVDILTTTGGITAGSSVTSNNDILFMNIWSFVAEQSACTSYKDTDGDGIPDYLDLDSDGDSCPDAIEGGGGFTNANLVTATGSLATQSPNKNLGNNVGSNGVPTIAGAGQNIGVSQNSNVNACTDSDGDGITNVYDLDNDNDGILDLNEKTCPLTGQTIRIGYIPNSRDLDGDTGYTFDGSLMSGSGALKLTNPANFGPNGAVNANIVLVSMGTAPITKAIINSLNLNAIFLGGINDAAATPNSYLSTAEFNAIKDWSDDSQNNYVVSTQAQTQPWGTSVVSQVSNPNVPTSYGSQTSIFKGPFGKVTSFTQGGGYQGYFSTINALFGANALAVNGSNGPVMYVDGIYNDLMIADVDILTTVGGITAGSSVTSNNDVLFMNIWAFVAEQSACTSYKDTDGDGIPDYLDLDSDGDSCPDAVEGGGGFTNANLVTATGSLATQNPNQNLGNNVGSNGVPTIAGAGQNIGVSQNSNVNACTDSDGDGITNVYDLDNDNDGILDVNEKTCPLTGQTIRIGYIPDSRSGNNGYTFNGSQMSGSGALKLTNPANFGPSGTVKANIVLVDMGTAPITKAIINSLNLNAIFLGGIDNLTTSYLSAGEFKAIKDWSDDSQNNYVVSTQIQTQFWDTSVVSQVSNPNVPTSYGSQTSIFKGPFGTVASFNQAGGYQGYFSAVNSSFGTNALAVNGSNGPVMYVDGIYNDLMIADVDILTALGGVTAGSGVTSNNDKLFMNIWAFVAEQSVCTSYKDTDGDGIPDYLDLDSDGDSCPDAIEGGGGFTSANLVTATGSLATQNPNQNLGNNVGSNGVPTIAGAGQSVGNSTNALVNLCFCYKTPVSPGGGNPNPVKYGITALNRAGSGSSEWPEVRRSAWAALESKSKGFVVNRMAFVDADSNPATPTTPPLASIPAANYVEGMMVYDTVANCLKIYNGTVWSCYSTQTCPD